MTHNTKRWEERALDILHDVVQHTPLELKETKGTDYDKGYIFYQDMVCRSVKENEPKLLALISQVQEELVARVLDIVEKSRTVEEMQGLGIGVKEATTRAQVKADLLISLLKK